VNTHNTDPTNSDTDVSCLVHELSAFYPVRVTSNSYIPLYFPQGDGLSDEVEVNVLGTNATLADSDVRSQTIHSFFKTLNSISLALFTSRLQGDGVADGDEDSDVSASDRLSLTCSPFFGMSHLCCCAFDEILLGRVMVLLTQPRSIPTLLIL